MDTKAIFLKTYANLPRGSREEIVAVIKGEPYTWQSAKLEIEQIPRLAQKFSNYYLSSTFSMHNQQNTEKLFENSELRDQLKSIVLERVGAMPTTLRIAIGAQELTKESLIKHIKEDDDIGRQYMVMELDFLQSLSSGAVYGNG